MIQCVYRQQLTERGRATGELWTSEPFIMETLAHVRRAVVAGYLSGGARWAETTDGTFLYGLDRLGKDLSAEARDEIIRVSP